MAENLRFSLSCKFFWFFFFPSSSRIQEINLTKPYILLLLLCRLLSYLTAAPPSLPLCSFPIDFQLEVNEGGCREFVSKFQATFGCVSDCWDV